MVEIFEILTYYLLKSSCYKGPVQQLHTLYHDFLAVQVVYQVCKRKKLDLMEPGLG
jgi:hypothetical protein